MYSAPPNLRLLREAFFQPKKGKHMRFKVNVYFEEGAVLNIEADSREQAREKADQILNDFDDGNCPDEHRKIQCITITGSLMGCLSQSLGERGEGV